MSGCLGTIKANCLPESRLSAIKIPQHQRNLAEIQPGHYPARLGNCSLAIKLSGAGSIFNIQITATNPIQDEGPVRLKPVCTLIAGDRVVVILLGEGIRGLRKVNSRLVNRTWSQL